MTEVLPLGWTWITVDDLAAMARDITDGPFGSNLKTEHYTSVGPRVIRLQNIGDGVFIDDRAHIATAHFERLHKHEARAGDVVVAMLGDHLPRACQVPPMLGPAVVKADCVRLRPNAAVANPAFVAAGLNSEVVRRQAEKLVHGVGRPRLGLKWLRTLPFPLAPLAEQGRIVDAIESLLSRLDVAVASLERAQDKLRAYRASVLTAAVEGRLVPTEAELARVERRGCEAADVLLKRILVERRQSWEQAELARLNTASTVRNDAKEKLKYVAPAARDLTALRELPEGWCWATVGQLAVVTGGLTKNSVRESLTTKLPYLRVANVYANALFLDEIKEIGVAPGELTRALLQRGDLLIVEGNGSIDQIGRVALWDGSISPIAHQNHLIKARFSIRPIERWALTWLLSPGGRKAIQAVASSTSGLHTLSISKVENLPIPVPPLREQERILESLDEKLSIIESSTAALDQSAQRCNRLRQSILKWAFEGRLVDQDPNDESADNLLARVRSERATHSVNKGQQRRQLSLL